MQAATTFEKEKNLKATLYTIVVCGLVLLLFFFIQWTLPQIPQPVADTGIEVNLGNSETGLGDIAPQVAGTPANTNETNISVPPPSASAAQSNQNISADENGDEEINNATKNIKAEVKPKATLPATSVHKKSTQNTVTATLPKPAPPKALYKGGNGNGGNYADSYNNIKNQGIAGGSGDQGKPNGNPNSNNYTGNGGTGTSGVSIRSGLDGRRFTRFPSFEDDFNEPAKVAVDITVDANGNVTKATFNPHGTTTTNANIKAIALKKAKLLKFNSATDAEQFGTIIFNFKLKD